jgi:His/Glu/Gln/Arg/opine family amino acid ABC transporter permease subunit
MIPGLSWPDALSILRAVGATLAISLAAIAIGCPVGLGVALIRWARIPGLAPAAAIYVSVIRACPAATLGLLLFFTLPMAGISVDAVTAGIVTLALITSGFNAEIWRAALLAFPPDQLEAALAVGMRRGLRFRLIVFPQILRASLPALVNEMTYMVKLTPAVAVLGVVDVTRAAVRIGAATYRPLPPLLAALAIYGIIVFCFLQAQRLIERRLGAGAPGRRA